MTIELHIDPPLPPPKVMRIEALASQDKLGVVHVTYKHSLTHAETLFLGRTPKELRARVETAVNMGIFPEDLLNLHEHFLPRLYDLATRRALLAWLLLDAPQFRTALTILQDAAKRILADPELRKSCEGWFEGWLTGQWWLVMLPTPTRAADSDAWWADPKPGMPAPRFFSSTATTPFGSSPPAWVRCRIPRELVALHERTGYSLAWVEEKLALVLPVRAARSLKRSGLPRAPMWATRPCPPVALTRWDAPVPAVGEESPGKGRRSARSG